MKTHLPDPAPPAPPAAPTEPARCPNCSAALTGRYCQECGQKRIEPAERRFTHFVGELVRELTLVDSRLLRSAARLLFRPGSLDRDWLEERRRRNVAPLSLFLLANLVYFFHPPLSDLNLTLQEQTGQTLYGPLAWSMVDARLTARGLTFAEYAAAYREQANAFAKLMVILHVPALAAVLMALHPRRGIYYVDHIAVGLHFWAFLLINFMATPFLLSLLYSTTGIGSRGLFQLAVAGLIVVYGWQQMRVGYAQRGWLAAAKLPFFLAGLIATHLLYRFVQFVAVYAST